MPTDPETCMCGKPLPKAALLAGDPFCSNKCARAAHHCSLPDTMAEKAAKQRRASDPMMRP